MKIVKRLLVVCLIFTFQNGFADAFAKGYQLYEFDTTVLVDSLFVFESDNKENLQDLDYNSEQRPWVTICEDNRCRAKASTYEKYQRIVVFVDGKPIKSNIYEPKGTNPTFKAQIQNDLVTVEEITSFIFKGVFGEILRALFITLIAFLVYLLRFQKQAVVDEMPEDDVALPIGKSMMYLIIGGLGLWGGSELLIEGAVNMAYNLGVSKRIIGITIISVGTSIPELAASIFAVAKKEKAISLGKPKNNSTMKKNNNDNNHSV